MSTPILYATESGSYRLLDPRRAVTYAPTRWTAFARWPLDPPVPSDAYGVVEDGSAYVERIDVDAADVDEAWRVAEAALARDFEPGGRIVSVARSEEG